MYCICASQRSHWLLRQSNWKHYIVIPNQKHTEIHQRRGHTGKPLLPNPNQFICKFSYKEISLSEYTLTLKLYQHIVHHLLRDQNRNNKETNYHPWRRWDYGTHTCESKDRYHQALFTPNESSYCLTSNTMDWILKSSTNIVINFPSSCPSIDRIWC